MKFQKKSEFSKEILETIDFCKGRVKTYQALTEIINKKYKTQFTTLQIKYQISKLLNQTFENSEEDVYNFGEFLKNETRVEGYFSYKTYKHSQFQSAVYLSKTMFLYYTYFSDIIIVDATYRRNRFNIPLVNVIGINNQGQNVMSAFSLLSNETIEAYTWLFLEDEKPGEINNHQISL